MKAYHKLLLTPAAQVARPFEGAFRKAFNSLCSLALAACVLGTSLLIQSAAQTPQYPNLPSETPTQVNPTHDGFEYDRREVMIPMRDGVTRESCGIVRRARQKHRCPLSSFWDQDHSV